MLRQTQTQRLAQKLSPQQIQLMKLLQVPTAQLEERIKDELESNPALDVGTDAETEQDPYGLNEFDEENKGNEDENTDYENAGDDYEIVDVSDYLREEDDAQGDYHLKENHDDDDEPRTIPVKVETTFSDYLNNQLGMLELDTLQRQIAEQVIGSIDDDGYLRRDAMSIADDLAFNRNIETNEEEVAAIIRKIQEFDPPGVAAKDLQECLLLQLSRQNERNTAVAHAITIIDSYFEEFTRKHYDKIKQRMRISEDEFRDAIGVILKLTPKPGSAFASFDKIGGYIIPDFFVYNNNGRLELSLNARNAPHLRISEGYREMLKTFDGSGKKNKEQKDALTFIKQKIDSAKWFIDAIKQRQHTLLVTMNAIMKYQEAFFLTGDEGALRPMILKDVADKINMDISTVSRVANSKYVQTEYGTFILKFFFSEAIVTDSGEEVSTREVKRILMDLIDEEDKRKPLSDEGLMELLAEKGYNVARRTVAKYREQLDIPVARLRKQV